MSDTTPKFVTPNFDFTDESRQTGDHSKISLKPDDGGGVNRVPPHPPTIPPLKARLSLVGFSVTSLSKAIGVPKIDVSNFINDRRKRVSKKQRKIIRDFLISIQFLPPRKVSPRCECPTCGRLHVQNKKRFAKSQSQTVEKNSATVSA